MVARIDHLVTSGTFALDGGTWDVDNNVWIVGDDTECVVIDAAHDAEAILAAVGDRTLRAVLLTPEGRYDAAGVRVDGARHAEAADQLGRLAAAGVPGAAPEDWHGLAPVSDDAPLVAEGEVVTVSPSSVESFGRCGLRWVLEGPAITAPIIGARTLEQLNDNLGAVDFALTDAQRQRLDEASALALPYPYDFIANAAKRDFGRVITAR